MNERVSGYVRYRQVPGSGWGYRIAVDDFMAEDQPTAIALWRYLGAHSMQAEHVEVPHACIDPLVLLLDEQDLKVLTTNRWMTRIVDLAAAIEQRPYPAGWRGSFSLIVDDPWPAGITGSWTVAIADGAGTAVRREDGADPPDGIALDVGALSALMIGRFSASTLRTAGRIRGTDAAVDTIDEVLRAPMPQLNDDF